jgi:DNA-binding beta-propeller fold protein YncE
MLPTGASLSPLGTEEALQPIPGVRAGQPATLALSPDGARLLTLTSGFNRVNGSDGKQRDSESGEWIFLHAVVRDAPQMQQAIAVPNAFLGVAWAKSSQRFWVSGGSDDVVHEYALRGGEFAEVLPPIALGHAKGLGPDMKPMAAGLALFGNRLIVANYENDSITVIDTERRSAFAELDLRPGKIDPAQRGQPGGAYPLAIAMIGQRAFVACVRDDEVVEIDVAGKTPRVLRRIHVGARPVALFAEGARVYVLSSGDDEVEAVEDGKIVARWPVLDEKLSRGLRGANPSALTAFEGKLYVTLGALNLVSIIPLRGGERSLLPTGWYPDAIATDGRQLFVANARSVAGPNPRACRDAKQIEGATKAGLAGGECRAANQYVWQLVKGTLQTIRLPSPGDARKITSDAEEGFRTQQVGEPFASLRGRIKHVIYVVKENRTYDQVLGDLAGADGDPTLTLFPEAITPNHHALSRSFVTLDRFFVSGQVSGDGWNWSTAARTSHVTEIGIAVQYAGRGLSYDWEGQNRNVNVSLPHEERKARAPELDDDDDLLPGPSDVAAPGTGYLWSAAIRKGLSVRNYGFFGDDQHYDPKHPGYLPPSHQAFADHALQFVANKEELRERSDPFFRTFDMKFADFWNLQEWKRELDAFEARGELPALSLVRLAHDHFGSFGEALDGVDTPDTQMADNDYALGLLVDALAASPFAKDTVVLALEDDAQDGPDHVDAHRSFLIAAGAHVRQGARISSPHTTVEVIRTIEALLGIDPMSLLDARAAPIGELFDTADRPWTYSARVPAVLRSTRLPVPEGPVEQPRGTRAAWERATEGMNFSTADALDPAAFNSVLSELLGQRDSSYR